MAAPLPRELILEILRYLSDALRFSDLTACALVCKEWLPFVREVLYRSPAATSLPFREPLPLASFLAAIRTPAVGSLLKALTLQIWGDLQMVIRQAKLAALHCPNIRSLQINSALSSWEHLSNTLSIPEIASPNISDLLLSFPAKRINRTTHRHAGALRTALKKNRRFRPKNLTCRYIHAFPKESWKFKRALPYSLTHSKFERCWFESDQLRLLLGNSRHTLTSIVLDSHSADDGYSGLYRALEPSAHCLRRLSLLQCEFTNEHEEKEIFALQRLISLFPSLELLDIEGYVQIDSDFLDVAVATTIRSLRLVPFDRGYPKVTASGKVQDVVSLYPPIPSEVWVRYLTGPRSQSLLQFELGLTRQWSNEETDRIRFARSDVLVTLLPPMNRARYFASGLHLDDLRERDCLSPRPSLFEMYLTASQYKLVMGHYSQKCYQYISERRSTIH